MSPRISLILFLGALSASPGLSAHPPTVAAVYADAQAQASRVLTADLTPPSPGHDIPLISRTHVPALRESAQSQARHVLDSSTPFRSARGEDVARDGERGSSPRTAVAEDAQAQAQRMLRAGGPLSEKAVQDLIIVAAH